MQGVARTPRAAGFAALVLAAVVALLCLAPRAGAAPNVVVLMTDDQTTASMKYMARTNALLGAQGTTFTHAIATFPLCCPSRTTALTGQYAHNHGILHNNPPFGGFAKFPDANTLPVWLQAAGYRTMFLGRYLNRYGGSVVPAGWDVWQAAPHANAFNYASWKLNENGILRSYPDASHPGEYQTDFFMRRAVELIEQSAPGDQPFFLNLWVVAPHSGGPRDADDPTALRRTPSPAPRHRDLFANVPMPRPPSFDEANMRDKPQVVADRRRFTPEKAAAVEENWRQELESLMAVDEGVERIVDALARTGELANTLFVYLSDNGFMHGEHRALAEKVLPYEPSIRVPLLMRGPGVPVGVVDSRLVGNIDVPATIAEAAGATPGRVLDGLSLLGLMRDPGAELGRGLLIENGNGANGIPAYRGIRTDRYLFVDHKETGERELYDLVKDPYELRNVAERSEYTPVRLDLAAKLARLQGCAGRGCHTRPRVHLLLRSAGRPLGSCVSDDVRVRVTGVDRAKVVRADVLLEGTRLATLRRQPLYATVPRTALTRSGDVSVRVRAQLRDGRRFTMDRPLGRACGRAGRR